MKKSLILASLLLAGTSAIANNNGDFYVGLGMSTGSGTFTATGNSSATADYNSKSTPIKFGMFMSNNNRFEFSLETVTHEFYGTTAWGNKEDKLFGWNMDWNFNYPNYKLGDIITPYWTIGFGFYNYNDTAQYFNDNEDLKGTAFN